MSIDDKDDEDGNKDEDDDNYENEDDEESLTGHSAHKVLLFFCSHLCTLCKISIGDDVDVDNDEDVDDDVDDEDDDDDSACIRVAVKFNVSQLFCLNELQ